MLRRLFHRDSSQESHRKRASIATIIADAFPDELGTMLLMRLWLAVDQGEANVYEQALPLPGQSGWYVTVEANATGPNIAAYRLDLVEWCEVYGIRLVLDPLKESASDKQGQYEDMRDRFDAALDRLTFQQVHAS